PIPTMPNPNASNRSNVPNYGSFGVALRIIILAELIAVIITVGRNPVFDEHAWQDLNLLSAFALTISFCGVAVLTLASPLLRRMSLAWGTVIAFLLLLLVAVFGTDFIIFALYDIGMIDQRWPVWRDSLMIRSLIITALVSVPALRYLLLAYRIEADAKSKQEATMQALQSRIRPHFLFNSLNSVASLTRHDPEKAEAVLHDIADLFRVLLADARKLVPISAEREISRQYLEVEKIRLGDRLKIKWNVSNVPRSALMPALILQPLLENAIYHGIEPRFSGGTIAIDMWTEGDTLNIMISNPLPENPRASHGRGNKIAQENIRQRLQTQFGNAASMQALQEGGQYHVKVKMPIVDQG
ncbi:MAG: histidine kinase, partial [Anaerolineales bacterium]